MELMHERCCGLDVHKETIMACVRVADGKEAARESIREFRTMTADLLQLGDWLREQRVRHVAMEATGVYWKPIWNLLESEFDLMLVNAHHIKAVPGRKTDVKDCQWIAQLLAHGLLRASFVPERPQRESRELVRWRVSLLQDRNRLANRVHKALEDANVKLASVATDVLGKSGRAMLESIVRGEDNPRILAELAQGRLRGKIPQLREALRGGVRGHHRFLLGEILAQIDAVDASIARVEARIDEKMRDFQRAVERLETVPGIGRATAQAMVAEIGVDMARFPTAGHLASWAGLCPGNNESAGKRKSGKTRRGNCWVRRVLVQAAWAASRSKKSYLKQHYHRIAARRGKKRAIVAVAHTLIVIYWNMMRNQTAYEELGEEYLDKLDRNRHAKYHLNRLQALGYNVQLNAA